MTSTRSWVAAVAVLCVTAGCITSEEVARRRKDAGTDTQSTGAGGVGSGGSGGATAGGGSGGATGAGGTSTTGSGGSTATGTGTGAGGSGTSTGSGGATGTGGTTGTAGTTGTGTGTGTGGAGAPDAGSPTGAGGTGAGGTGAGGTGTGAGGSGAGGPIARYPFNETTGTVAADTSGRQRNGTVMGTSTWGAGMIGGALTLNGTNSYVALPAGLLSAASQATIAVWVKLRTARDWQRVFDFGANATTNMFLTPQNGATATMRFAITTGGNAGEEQIDGNGSLPIGAWHHLAVVLTGSSGTLYVDGQVAGTNPAMTLVPSALGATANNWIGRSQYAADPYLDGQVDELVIYDRALSAAEVAALAGP